MGFWFEHLPKSYPPLQETIDKAGVRSSNGDPREGINYLLKVTGSLPPSPLKDGYSDYVRFQFAKNQLVNPTITPEAKIGVFTALFAEPTPELADGIANIGKSWSLEDEEGDRQLGLKLLTLAAGMFENVVTGFGRDVPMETRFKIIVEDYFRVASLQDEAGDKTGATATATMVVPHLITLSKTRLDRDQKSFLNHEMELAALYVADANPAMVEELVGVMSAGSAKKTKGILEKKRVTRLIDSATEADIDSLLKSFGEEPDFSFWHYLKDMVSRENDPESYERARWLIGHVDKFFPKLFDEANDRLLPMFPVEQVLYFTNRDDLLARYYKSVIAAQKSVHMMSKFAGECGSRADIARFETMVQAVGLDPADSRTLYQTYFEPNRDKTSDHS